jgi:hypothetical protein
MLERDRRVQSRLMPDDLGFRRTQPQGEHAFNTVLNQAKVAVARRKYDSVARHLGTLNTNFGRAIGREGYDCVKLYFNFDLARILVPMTPSNDMRRPQRYLESEVLTPYEGDTFPFNFLLFPRPEVHQNPYGIRFALYENQGRSRKYPGVSVEVPFKAARTELYFHLDELTKFEFGELHRTK